MVVLTGTWVGIRDGDGRGLSLHRRHYPHKNPRPKQRQFVGPGEYIALLTVDGRSLFVWRKFIDNSGQQGVNCAIFRKEGPGLASEMILEAEEFALERWPGERFYTYIDPDEVSDNPGYCFKMAGWQFCGITKGGLHILEKCN